MKQLLLTLLYVLTITGCNNTTEPVIPDAVTYTSIDYMPIDTSITYVYVNSKSNEYVFKSIINDFTATSQTLTYNVNTEKIKFNKEYVFQQINALYPRPELMMFTNESLFAGVENYVELNNVLIGNYYPKDIIRTAVIYKRDIDNDYKVCTKNGVVYTIEKLTTYITNNIRYRDVLKIKQIEQLGGESYTTTYYLAKGIGLIKIELTNPSNTTTTMLELQRTYK